MIIFLHYFVFTFFDNLVFLHFNCVIIVVHEEFLLGAVLSDANKRFLYDIGVYESDDDESVSLQFPLQSPVLCRPCAAGHFLSLIGWWESTRPFCSEFCPLTASRISTAVLMMSRTCPFGTPYHSPHQHFARKNVKASKSRWKQTFWLGIWEEFSPVKTNRSSYWIVKFFCVRLFTMFIVRTWDREKWINIVWDHGKNSFRMKFVINF